MNFPTDNAAELIDETLMEYLEGKTSREDLMPIINKIKKSRLQKRARWYKALNLHGSFYLQDTPSMFRQ